MTAVAERMPEHSAGGAGDACHCCGGPLEPVNTALCGACGRRFHLVIRTDVPGRDCGSVWIDENLQALAFGCNSCLGRAPRAEAAGGLRRYTRRSVSTRELLAARAGRRRRNGE